MPFLTSLWERLPLFPSTPYEVAEADMKIGA